jgi:hypothetical protein
MARSIKEMVRWILWWQIDKSDLDRQVSKYNNLTITSTIRGQAAALLLLSATTSALFIYFEKLTAWSYIDVVLFSIFATFVYYGHRWAMIFAMILWTVEKGSLIYEGIGHNSGLGQIGIWCIYMHAFYFSFRVEQKRKRPLLEGGSLRVVTRLSMAAIALASFMAATILYSAQSPCHDSRLYFMAVPGAQSDGCR